MHSLWVSISLTLSLGHIQLARIVSVQVCALAMALKCSAPEKAGAIGMPTIFVDVALSCTKQTWESVDWVRAQ